MRQRRRGSPPEVYQSALDVAPSQAPVEYNDNARMLFEQYLQDGIPSDGSDGYLSSSDEDGEPLRDFFKNEEEMDDSSDYSDENDDVLAETNEFFANPDHTTTGDDATEQRVRLLSTSSARRPQGRAKAWEAAGSYLRTIPDMQKARRRMLTNSMAEDFRWLAFSWVGDGPLSIIPRLLMLWVIGLPLLVMKLAVSILLLYLTMGLPAMAAVGTTVGVTVPLQMYYRDVLKWAMHDDTFQDVWDAVASALAISLALLVYTTRLFVEIHNGFCPLLTLCAGLLYEVAIQLSVIWYAAPALQYIALWLLRLFVFLMEPTLDLLVTVFETFMFLVVETASVIGSLAEEI